MSAVTLTEVKTYLRIPVDFTDDDTELQAAIDSAEASISARVGPLSLTAKTETVDGGGALCLSVLPVASLVSVTPRSGTALIVSDLLLDQDSGIVTYANGVTGFSSSLYTVVYQAGYATLPADLRNAVKELVRVRFAPQRGGAGRPGTGADQSGDAPSEGWFPKQVQQLLENYDADEQGFA